MPIHPTAQIGNNVNLGCRVTIGPYVVIDNSVEIGDDCVISAHAVIHSNVIMGQANEICPHAVLGGLPQDMSFDRQRQTYVKIGDNNTFREGVTVNRATQTDASTVIGSDCYFMNGSHVAHDCSVGNGSIFASGVAIGGHVAIGEKVFLGGGAMVHQFCRIGSMVMVSGTVGVLQDIIPYTMVGDSPARHYRLNVVGLRRAGITGKRYKLISTAFRRMKNKESLDDLDSSPEIDYLRTWLAEDSTRGLSSFLVAS